MLGNTDSDGPNRNDFNSKIGKYPPEPFVDNLLEVSTQQRMEAEWGSYAHVALCVDAGEEPGEPAGSARRAPTALIEFERDVYDLPLLSPLKEYMKTDEINVIIRSFLTIHYCESHNPTGITRMTGSRFRESDEESEGTLPHPMDSASRRSGRMCRSRLFARIIHFRRADTEAATREKGVAGVLVEASGGPLRPTCLSFQSLSIGRHLGIARLCAEG